MRSARAICGEDTTAVVDNTGLCRGCLLEICKQAHLL